MIERFWDGLAQTEVLDKMSFGSLAGPQVLSLIQQYLDQDISCLDYGGGDGAA